MCTYPAKHVPSYQRRRPERLLCPQLQLQLDREVQTERKVAVLRAMPEEQAQV